MGQPLIIIGTKPPTNAPAPINPPPVVPAAISEVPTNMAVPATNPVVAQIIVPVHTNPPAVAVSSPENSGPGTQTFKLVGAGLTGAAIVFGLVMILRLRRKEASLITRSMDDRH